MKFNFTKLYWTPADALTAVGSIYQKPFFPQRFFLLKFRKGVRLAVDKCQSLLLSSHEFVAIKIAVHKIVAPPEISTASYPGRCLMLAIHLSYCRDFTSDLQGSGKARTLRDCALYSSDKLARLSVGVFLMVLRLGCLSKSTRSISVSPGLSSALTNAVRILRDEASVLCRVLSVVLLVHQRWEARHWIWPLWGSLGCGERTHRSVS